jgi:hypothetical protein
MNISRETSTTQQGERVLRLVEWWTHDTSYRWLAALP